MANPPGPRQLVRLTLACVALLTVAIGSVDAQTVCSGGSGPPVCNGTCPTGQDCIDGGGVCVCLPRCDPLTSGSPVCSGTCPAGTVCDVEAGCHCLPSCASLSASVCTVTDGEAGGCPYPLECQVVGAACQCVAVTSTCGNGMVERGEECDGADDAACPGRCQPSCGCLRACGDGALDPGEQCDDGNTVAGDGCNATCRIETTVPTLTPLPTMALAIVLTALVAVAYWRRRPLV